jgi:hypothetical protein
MITFDSSTRDSSAAATTRHLMALPPQLKQQILAAAQHEPAPVRRQVVLQTLVIAAIAVAVPLVAFFQVGGLRSGDRPLSLVLATAVGAFAIAAVTLILALGRGPRMLGRARGWLVLAGVIAPLAFLAWKAGLSAEFDLAAASPTRPGYRCLILTLSFALAPLSALLFIRRGSDPAHPRSLGLALGIGAGTAAAALVDLWCPVGHLRHLVLGHVLPIVALGILGIWLGQRLLSVRSSAPVRSAKNIKDVEANRV